VSFSVQVQNSNHLEEGNLKRDSPTIIKGLDAITSSLTHIGGTIGKSLEVSFDKKNSTYKFFTYAIDRDGIMGMCYSRSFIISYYFELLSVSTYSPFPLP
jgi:hypothetical protein